MREKTDLNIWSSLLISRPSPSFAGSWLRGRRGKVREKNRSTFLDIYIYKRTMATVYGTKTDQDGQQKKK
jgi:hypothetical protein